MNNMLLAPEVIEMIYEYNSKRFEYNSKKIKYFSNNDFNRKILNYKEQILELFEKEYKKVRNYEKELEQKYTEDEQITIENMISYYENKMNGFDILNDELCFEESKQDIRLYEEVQNWLEISKTYNFLKNIVRIIKNFRSPKICGPKICV